MPNPRPEPKAPRIAPERLLVAITNGEPHGLDSAREYGLGAEIQLFSMPPYLGRDCRVEAEELAKRLAELSGPIGYHGPFMDIPHFSPDPAIRALSRERHLEAFPLAEQVGARYIVFHTQYNPLLRFHGFDDMYHEANLAFWPPLIEEAERRDVTLYLENMFDPSPAPVLRIMNEIDHPRFKLCLDVAHAMIYSDVDLAQWIAQYRDKVGLVHLNDCDGKRDLHLGLGEGSLDLDRALKLLRDSGQDLLYTLETNHGEEASARWLGLQPQRAQRHTE